MKCINFSQSVEKETQYVWILPASAFVQCSPTSRKRALGLWTSGKLCDFGGTKQNALVYINSFPRGIAVESVISREYVTKCCYTFERRTFPLDSRACWPSLSRISCLYRHIDFTCTSPVFTKQNSVQLGEEYIRSLPRCGKRAQIDRCNNSQFLFGGVISGMNDGCWWIMCWLVMLWVNHELVMRKQDQRFKVAQQRCHHFFKGREASLSSFQEPSSGSYPGPLQEFLASA